MFCKSTQGGELYKVHKEIESFIGHVPGVTSELTTSGIRVFAGDQMAQQHILNIDGALVRGGWHFEGESCLFYHITKILHLSQDGLVLGYHSDPKKNGVPFTAFIASSTTITERIYITTLKIYLGPRLVLHLIFLQ